MDKDFQIRKRVFPSVLLSNSEKDSSVTGLEVGEAIQYEWFSRDGRSSSSYYSRLNTYTTLRLYARGEQSTQKYKEELSVDGDLSYLNMDWSIVPVIPKFVDIVVNGMSNRMFKVKANAQDAMSQSNRSRYQRMVEGQMAAKDVLSIVQDKTGFNPFTMNPEDLPENDEQLSLHMQLHFKPSIEIAEEVSLTTVLNENDFLELRKELDYDQVVLGVSFACHEFQKGAGIKVSRLDPAEVIHSYTEDPYFRDCFYWGNVKTIPISEVYKINPDIPKEQLKEITDASKQWNNYHDSARYIDGIFSEDTCNILRYWYKTTRRVVYKKKMLDDGGVRVVERDDDFNPTEEDLATGRFEKIEKVIDVWYEGVMVLGTQILLKWELAKNMARPKSAAQYAISPVVGCAPRMYKGVTESLVRRMKPFADLIQVTHLKIQQVIQRMVPDGVFLDADGLNGVDLGNGGNYTPEDALRLYFQTGSVVGRSYTTDGDFNNARIPIQELSKNSGGSKLQTLIAAYNHYLDSIRTVTGLNEARDGSTPDPRALVGLQKLAALNSNTATRHILDSTLYVFKKICQAVSLRISDLLEYSDEMRDNFINKVGAYNTSIIDEIKDLYLYDFGIDIHMAPDEEEKNKLEENIQMALSKGDIHLEDAIDVREIDNVKLANQLLKIKRIKKQENDQKMQMQRDALVGQQNQMSQQMAAKAAIEKINAEAMGKMKVKQAEIAFEIQKMNAEASLKERLMHREFMYNMQLRGIDQSKLSEREKEKEKAKSKRIAEQNTQQSQLINQRKNNLPPMKFESEEDSLDGFGLESFSPR
jgi:hypothetical protein